MFKAPSIDKYKFYVNPTKKKIIAVSSYAGRPVRAVAICDNEDEFDLEKGKKLAAARCNAAIAKKRMQRASKRYDEANRAVKDAKRHLHMMDDYYEDAVEALVDADEEVARILAKM